MEQYLIKSTLCSAVFLVIYFLFFQKEKTLIFNRFYLLVALIISYILPMLQLPTSQVNFKVTGFEGISDKTLIKDTGADAIANSTFKSQVFDDVLLWCWVIISAILIFRFLNNIFKIQSDKYVKNQSNYLGKKVILIPNMGLPYSFMNKIYVNDSDYYSGKIAPEIMQHEYAHITQKHSFDLIFIEICLCVLWFNPFLYLYKKAIQLNHEFLADAAVVSHTSNVVSYQMLLLKTTISASKIAFASSFNFFTTKQRMIMITKTKNTKFAVAKQLLLVPILLGMIVIFGRKNNRPN